MNKPNLKDDPPCCRSFRSADHVIEAVIAALEPLNIDCLGVVRPEPGECCCCKAAKSYREDFNAQVESQNNESKGGER